MKQIFLLLCIPLFSYARETTQLSLNEKIGQLFMVAAVSDEELNKEFMTKSCYSMTKEYVTQLIQQYHIGGIIFLGRGTKQKQIERAHYFQSLSKIPLLIGQDFEPGLISRRIIDGIEVPWAQELGQQDDETVYKYAQQIADQAHELGIHIVFAPVADINTNPNNPVIGKRAFGQTQELVAQKSLTFMRGLQDAGIIACAKHFPGHGDTSTDSHEVLPYIAHTDERINEVELYPFKKLIDAGVEAMMLGHLVVEALDPQKVPTSISRTVITEVLKNKLGFSGLVVTDGFGMKALTNHYTQGDIAVKALQAGADLLLCPVDVPAAIQAIKQALISGDLSEQDIDEHSIKIMKLKQKIIRNK
jgi:beta-glucosidase-like glycosyl hydrolase